MQVAGDADPLLLCAEGAEPAEPAGVVDGEGEHLGKPRQQHRVVGVVAGLRRMLQAEDADDLAPGGQPDVQAGTAGPDDRSERLGAGVEVALADDAVVVEGSTERRRQVGTRIGGPQSAPVGDLGHPLLGVVVECHQADDPGVEAVLELLSDPLQGFAQRQRVGEGARHHVEHLEELVGLRQVVDLAEESDATAFGVLDAGPDVAGDHDREDQGDDGGDVALVGHHVGDGPSPDRAGDGDGDHGHDEGDPAGDEPPSEGDDRHRDQQAEVEGAGPLAPHAHGDTEQDDVDEGFDAAQGVRRSELHRHHRAPGRDEHAHGGGDDRGVGPSERGGGREDEAVAEGAPAQHRDRRRHRGAPRRRQSEQPRGLVQATVGEGAHGGDGLRHVRGRHGRVRGRSRGDRTRGGECRFRVVTLSTAPRNPAGPREPIAGRCPGQAPDGRPGDGAGPGGGS